MLTKGMAVVRHYAQGEDVTLRIVAVHPTGRCIAVIPALTDKKVWPQWEDRDDWERALKQGAIEPCEQDPHAQLFDPKYDDPALQDQFEKYAECRDFRLMVIKPLVATPDIFDRHKRGPLVAARVKEVRALKLPKKKRASKNSINKWLRLYWQGGMRPNALVPRWEWNRRGGKAQKQFPELQLTRVTDKQQRLWHGVQATMAWGLKKYRASGLSLRLIRTRINAKFFNHGHVLKDGVSVPVLKQQNITIWMLRHFYRTHWDKAQELKSQIGDDDYDSNFRAETGTACLRASAPGDCFQCDATELPVTIVSSLNRALEQGKAVLCLVVDQFTEMFCGYSIDFRAEDSMAYRLAIDHAHTNKVEWCARLGRTITAEDWPCEHLAKTYVTDRGPLRKWLGNQLVNTLLIDIENGPAYRPDLRGLVESLIGVIKKKALKLDGATPRPRTPGRRKKNRQPCLTLEEIDRIIMNEIICHNKRVLANRRLTKAMIRDLVPRVPIKLWAWGVRRLGGSLRKEDVNTLRLNLLPQAYGSITKEGLVFQQRLYACNPALVEKARREGRIKVLVHYHPYRLEEIYRRVNLRTTTIEVCPLSKGDAAWHGTTDQEHASIMNVYHQVDAEAEHEFQQARSEADAHNDALQREARKGHAEDQRALGVTKNVQQGTGSRRKEAQAKRDEEGAWRLSVDQASSALSPPAVKTHPDDLYWDALEMNTPKSSATP